MSRKILPLALSTIALFIFALNVHAQVSGLKPELVMLRHNGGPVSPAPAVDGNTIGTIKWNALTAINNTMTGASIRSVAATVAPGYLRADLRFATSGFDRAIITENGLMGVGTMTPLYHLDVVGNTHTSGRFYGRIHFDTGSPTDLPATYIDEAYFERKTRAELGLGANAYNNGGILSLAPGGGSLDRQLFSGGTDGLWTRSQDAAGGNSWDAWHKLLTSEDINGNVGRVARFTGATLGDPSSTLGNSQLFDDGTHVGIGTTSPDAAYMLTVGGNSRTNGNARITGDAGVGGNASVTGNTTTGSLNVGSNAIISGNTTTGSLDVNANAKVSGESRLVGKVLIGSDPMSAPGSHSLYVGGSAIAEEVVVKLKASWPDYVFADAHQLTPLAEVGQYVEKEKHLPGVPAASAVAENGLALGEMQKIQMEKIEELYLHLIAMEKRINALETENKELKSKVEQLENR